MIVPKSDDGQTSVQRSDDDKWVGQPPDSPPPPPEPEVVYHYTSIETLLKIVEHPAIHATNVNYLNDTTEREHLLRLVHARLPAFIQANKLEDSDIFTAFLEPNDTQDRSVMLTPFAASFCKHGDLLTQWRSYCPNGNGVSIGFRTECLQRASVVALHRGSGWSLLDAPPNVSFQEVLYLEEGEAKIDDLISDAMKWALATEQDTTEDDPSHGMTATDLFRLKIAADACFIKNPVFSNEREYRLLVNPLYLNYQRLEFRTSKSTLIPYVNVLFPLNATLPVTGGGLAQMLTGRNRRTDFIDRVILGPTPNPHLSRDAVECFFEKNSLNVEVALTKVPYRDL